MRPSFLPCTTRPEMEYGWPSNRSTCAKSPCASAARTPDEEIRLLSSRTAGKTSTVKPNSLPASTSIARLPARFAPKQKSSPTISHFTCNPCTRTFSMKSRGDSAAKCALKCSTMTRSMPASANDCNLSRRFAMRVGAFDGSPVSAAKNSRGCGSNVITAASMPRARAASRTCASNAWWPRCTPSKLPIVSAHGARDSALGSPRNTFMALLRGYPSKNHGL